MYVRVRLAGPPIECAEGAHDVANVGVIDVAVDDVRDDIAGIFTLTDLVSREADADKIVRFEQCGTIVGREAFAT